MHGQQRLINIDLFAGFLDAGNAIAKSIASPAFCRPAPSKTEARPINSTSIFLLRRPILRATARGSWMKNHRKGRDRFAATLQAAQGCAKTTLVRIKTKAGHGAGRPTKITEEIANRWAFLVKVLGMKIAKWPRNLFHSLLAIKSDFDLL
jgi:hypothetical protein